MVQEIWVLVKKPDTQNILTSNLLSIWTHPCTPLVTTSINDACIQVYVVINRIQRAEYKKLSRNQLSWMCSHFLWLSTNYFTKEDKSNSTASSSSHLNLHPVRELFACSDFCTQPLNKTLGASISLRANVVHIAETAHKCAILRPYKHTGQQTAHSHSLTALGYYTHLLMGPK